MVKFTDILNETPQIVGDDDWQLSNQKVNRTKAQEILSYNPEIIQNYPLGDLMRLAGDSGGIYAFINKSKMVEYFVQYEIHKVTGLGKRATQVKLWRKLGASVRNLARIVFDDYLLNNFDAVVSDSRQTQRGVEFWMNQLGGRQTTNVIGVIYGAEIRIYDRTQELTSWLANVDGWGKSAKYRNLRFFISAASLPS